MSELRKRIPILSLLAAFASAPPCIGQDLSGSRDLSFWTVGSGGATTRFGPELYRILENERDGMEAVMLALAEQPLAEGKIADRAGLSDTRVRDLISRLSSVNLIRRETGDRWATTLPVITDDQMLRIRVNLTPMARAVARRMSGELPTVAASYDAVKAPTDPSWEEIAHLIVDKFLVDGAFHGAVNRLVRERGVGQQLYSQDQQIIPAFFLERGEHFSTFGSNWYAFRDGEGQREVYVLHGAVFNRYDIRMNAYRRDPLLSAALFGLSPSGGIESLKANEKAVLNELDWIEDERLMVPVVQAGTIKSLLPGLEDIGVEGAQVVFERHSMITDAFDQSPYAGFLDGAGDFMQVCYHALFGLVLEQFAEVNLLPEFPAQVPEHFGVYIIMGKVY